MSTRYYLELLLMAEKGCIDEYGEETIKLGNPNYYDLELSSSFGWHRTRRGHNFWSFIDNEACELIRGAQNEN